MEVARLGDAVRANDILFLFIKNKLLAHRRGNMLISTVYLSKLDTKA